MYLTPANETQGSLNSNASKHKNFLDDIREGFGAVGLAPKVENINWADREFDENGRVKVSDAFYNVSQPELQAQYEKHRQQQIKLAGGRDYRKAFGKTLKIDETTDLNEIEAQIDDETNRKTDTKLYLAAISQMENGGAVIAELGPKPTKQAVQQALSTLKTRNLEEGRSRVTRKENKADDLQMLLLSQQGQRNNNQFAIQMAQQDYQNRALEMKDARLERRDRQSAIQQMMAGLSTLGASIAI